MVKLLSKPDAQALRHAVAEAERGTNAELSVIVARASHTYHEFFMVYGLLLGSVLALGLWHYGITDAPLLLAAQLAVTALFCLPWTRMLVPFLIPRRIRHAHAARRAREEFQLLAAHAPADTRLLVWYIAQAERYTHIHASRALREILPDSLWEESITRFTASIAPRGLTPACIDTIASLGALLADHFPPDASGRTGHVHVE